MNIQKLREIPIEQVATNLGLKVQKHKTLCPFHSDKHPSLSFKVSKNTFKCFACGAHGSTITLAMQVLGKDFKETCHWLASFSCHPELVSGSVNHQPEKSEIINHKSDIKTKYSKFFEHPYLNMAAKRFLYTERKIHPGVVRWCHLNSWTDRKGVSWIQIPYYDRDGTLIGVQNRRLSSCHPTPLSRGAGVCHEQSEGSVNVQPSTLNVPRFKFPKGSQCQIYNLPILNRLAPGEEIYIAEGCSDCWALLSSGKKALAIASATLLKTQQIEVLKGLNLHMYPDSDIPGEKLFLQLKEHCPQLVRHQLPSNCKDFSEYYIHCHPEQSEGSDELLSKAKNTSSREHKPDIINQKS